MVEILTPQKLANTGNQGVFPPQESVVRYLSGHHRIAFIWDSGPNSFTTILPSHLPPFLWYQKTQPFATLTFYQIPAATLGWAGLICPLWFCVPCRPGISLCILAHAVPLAWCILYPSVGLEGAYRKPRLLTDHSRSCSKSHPPS